MSLLEGLSHDPDRKLCGVTDREKVQHKPTELTDRDVQPMSFKGDI